MVDIPDENLRIFLGELSRDPIANAMEKLALFGKKTIFQLYPDICGKGKCLAIGLYFLQ